MAQEHHDDGTAHEIKTRSQQQGRSQQYPMFVPFQIEEMQRDFLQ